MLATAACLGNTHSYFVAICSSSFEPFPRLLQASRNMSSPGLASSFALPMLAMGLLSDKAVENAVFVGVNGVRYEIPPSWTTAEATRVYNLEIPVAELKYVYMPLTQIEHLNGATPKLFSEVVGCVSSWVGMLEETLLGLLSQRALNCFPRVRGVRLSATN